jgi:hypothetical protein
MHEYLKRKELLIGLFLFFLFLFTIIYSRYMSQIDAFYTSVSFQTFTGTNIIDKDESLKLIACFQMITTYILISIVFYNIYSA